MLCVRVDADSSENASSRQSDAVDLISSVNNSTPQLHGHCTSSLLIRDCCMFTVKNQHVSRALEQKLRCPDITFLSTIPSISFPLMLRQNI